jgi:hypothetical protein
MSTRCDESVAGVNAMIFSNTYGDERVCCWCGDVFTTEEAVNGHGPHAPAALNPQPVVVSRRKASTRKARGAR